MTFTRLVSYCPLPEPDAGLKKLIRGKVRSRFLAHSPRRTTDRFSEKKLTAFTIANHPGIPHLFGLKSVVITGKRPVWDRC